ncbi:MAG: hypothetical protein EWV75_04150 [Microcystis wesenbergii Mw_QC_S_20081001_S30D]|jgi:regulator of protease activity HflC (stomatin/prohibitin superfamily)|uniref:Band 7 domain-containing protein n=1 Tax=Microcystis wesenbergii Mw_QC_S_20081001_S30D TaxID=2486245 RepID=A0A552JW45_9CHRO|nr:MAG: hypothetical protein EWV75_04150 [Microcystis wesenbergii Mw_QC_S_20081001_S30D]TRV00022.1 MAG: hypothetical protein EWV74_13165 [Microcystis wesenbergii Mw_QC_S_20081001_S30]
MVAVPPKLRMTPKLGMMLLGGAITLIVIKVLLRAFVIVQVGEVGVIDNPQKILAPPLMPGVYWLNPLDNVVKISTRTQVQHETLELTSQEGINFAVNVGLKYHINPQKSGTFYQVIGDNAQAILRENLAAALRSAASQYSLKVIYGNQNQVIAAKVQSLMNQALDSQGLVIDGVSLIHFILPEEVKSSIQERFIAEQQAEKRKTEAKGLADALRNFQGLIAPQNVINVVSDDSSFIVKDKNKH